MLRAINFRSGSAPGCFEGALSRVTRMYAAGLADVFTETLQNSRRAGATSVRVTIDATEDTPGVLAVTVTDDGAGIADPAVLLSFGENGWSEDLVRREDAAGMGFLSLARRGCTVASRPRVRRAVRRPRLGALISRLPTSLGKKRRPSSLMRAPHGPTARRCASMRMRTARRSGGFTRERGPALPAPGHTGRRGHPPPGLPRWRRPRRVLAGPRLRRLHGA